MESENYTQRSSRFSWFSLIIGVISIIVGIWCIFTPVSTLAALTLLFIIGFFVTGAIELVQAFSSGGSHWGWRLVSGIINILLGVWLCAMPAAQAATVMVYLVGFWIFFYSAMGIGEALHLRHIGFRNWGWMLTFNIIGLLCAFLFLMGPVFGGMFIVWLVGLSFISYGISRCMLP